MKIAKRGSKYYLIKRVPKRYSGVETRKQVWVALGTDSKSQAEKRAFVVANDLENQWQAKLTGENCDTQKFENLSEIASTRGFQYMPADQVAVQSLFDLLKRVTSAQENETVAEAVLGSVKSPNYRLSDIADLYFELTAVEVKNKGRDQRRMWENTVKRCLKRFITAVGDKKLDELTREDGLAFRQHWAMRIEEEGLTTTSANRELTAVSGVFTKLYKLKGIGNPDLFKNLSFTSAKKRRPPYDQDYIKHQIIPALNSGQLNQDAADILKIIINTGMRPSEVTGLAAEDVLLSAEVPYLAIRPREGRELKTQTSIRDIPLVGIALEAAKNQPDGFARYFDKTGSLTQTLNKFLRVNKLQPTPGHTVYSFRHGFQDRLTAIEAPDRIQADLMGHRYVRERYGVGPSLAQKADWLSRVGFF